MKARVSRSEGEMAGSDEVEVELEEGRVWVWPTHCIYVKLSYVNLTMS